MIDLDQLDFAKGGGVVTVVTQDAASGAVLMVAAADREALEAAVATGEMHYRSRSRGLWRKGATSGNVQRVVRLLPDCDGDAVLALVQPAGPSCHTGAVSCFAAGPDGFDTPVSGRTGSTPSAGHVIDELDRVIAERAHAGDPVTSFTARLLGDRNLRLKKLGEEAAELAVAAADGDRHRAVEEAADLLYHVLVVVRALGGSARDVAAALARRRRQPA